MSDQADAVECRGCGGRLAPSAPFWSLTVEVGRSGPGGLDIEDAVEMAAFCESCARALSVRGRIVEGLNAMERVNTRLCHGEDDGLSCMSCGGTVPEGEPQTSLAWSLGTRENGVAYVQESEEIFLIGGACAKHLDLRTLSRGWVQGIVK